jgi:glutathione S-transferase
LDNYRGVLDTYLASIGPYLLGERFSSADLFLFTLTRWGRRLERRWWDAPALARHCSKVKNRTAMERVFEQEGLDDDA